MPARRIRRSSLASFANYGANCETEHLALSLAQTAKEQHPDNPNIADTLGWIYYKKTAYGLAIAQLEDSREKMPQNPEVHYHLGMAYYKNGDPERAKQALQQALQLRQDFPGAEEARAVLERLP